jgi:hypothetical protein
LRNSIKFCAIENGLILRIFDEMLREKSFILRIINVQSARHKVPSYGSEFQKLSSGSRQRSRGAPLAGSGGGISLRMRGPACGWVASAFNVETDRI